MTSVQSAQPVALIVGDNPANMLLAKAVLRRAGYHTLQAWSAEEALDQLTQRRPDLILMDIELPGRSGLDLTRELKNDVSTASIVIVAVTAYARDEDRRNALEAGCDGYITKPISVTGLAAELSNVIASSKSTQRNRA